MHLKSALWTLHLLVGGGCASPTRRETLESRGSEIPDPSEFNSTKNNPYQIPAKPNGLSVKRPNMILFMPDQLRFDCMIKPPNIDAFAKEGIKFTNTFAQAPTCSQYAPETITAQDSCLPCQHTSTRDPFDQDTMLWASWGVKSSGKSVWFGGDTGYGLRATGYRAVPAVPENADD